MLLLSIFFTFTKEVEEKYILMSLFVTLKVFCCVRKKYSWMWTKTPGIVIFLYKIVGIYFLSDKNLKSIGYLMGLYIYFFSRWIKYKDWICDSTRNPLKENKICKVLLNNSKLVYLNRSKHKMGSNLKLSITWRFFFLLYYK